MGITKIPGNSVGGAPAAPDTSIQFNSSGVFGGSADLTWSADGLTNLRHIAIGADSVIGSSFLVDAAEELSGDFEGEPTGALRLNVTLNSSGTEDEMVALTGSVSSSAVSMANLGALLAMNFESTHNGDGNIGILGGIFATVTHLGDGNADLIQGISIGASVAGDGTATESQGLAIADITGAVTNWAIKTGLGLVEFGDRVQFDTDGTGAGTPLLGTNCPAITLSAPYTWITAQSSDGSTVYIPAWK